MKPEGNSTASIEERVRMWHIGDPGITDPYPFMSELRNQCPVAYTERVGGYHIVSRHEDVATVLRDYKTFSSTEISVPPIADKQK